MRRRGPRCVHDEGSRICTFEAQSHGFGTDCLRFAGRVAPTLRKTRFRLLARLFQTGLITRRVPAKGFEVYPTSQPPFPSSTQRKDALMVGPAPKFVETCAEMAERESRQVADSLINPP